MNNKRKHSFGSIEYLKSTAYITISLTLANPIDLIRFRLMSLPDLIESGQLSSPYKGLFDCGRRILKEEGIKALWKGNLSNLMRIIPNEAIIFELKQLLHKKVEKHLSVKLDHVHAAMLNGAIGMASSLSALLLLYPFDYARIMLSNQVNKNGTGIFKCLSEAVKKHGFTRIYAGISNFAIGSVLYRGVYFGIYDSFKNDTELKYQKWLLSYFSSIIAMVAIYPTTVLRRRMVAYRQKYPKRMIAAAKFIFENEGIRGLFLGMQCLPIQSVFYCSMYFIYDMIFTDLNQD